MLETHIGVNNLHTLQPMSLRAVRPATRAALTLGRLFSVQCRGDYRLRVVHVLCKSTVLPLLQRGRRRWRLRRRGVRGRAVLVHGRPPLLALELPDGALSGATVPTVLPATAGRGRLVRGGLRPHAARGLPLPAAGPRQTAASARCALLTSTEADLGDESSAIP